MFYRLKSDSFCECPSIEIYTTLKGQVLANIISILLQLRPRFIVLYSSDHQMAFLQLLLEDWYFRSSLSRNDN